MENKTKFLNRKTLRKMKRQEKKNKKDFFYKGRKNSDSMNIPDKYKKNVNVVKENQTKYNNIQNNKKVYKKEEQFDSEDDEIDSENVSEVDSENIDFDDENQDEDIQEENNRETDDLDLEIKQLEKKLGLKAGKTYDKFKKKVANENYDDDLFDFLDNISKQVKPIKTEKKESIKPVVKTKETKETKEVKNPESLPVNSPVKTNLKEGSRLFAHLKISDDDKNKINFQKEITTIFNKISEANLTLMFPDFLQKIDNFRSTSKVDTNKNLLFTYEVISKVCIKMTLEQEITNLPITSCICSYLSILHYKFGNSFMLYFFKCLWEKVDPILQIDNFTEELENQSKYVLKNFIFVIIHFFIFENCSSKLYFDLIRHFIANFNNLFSENLLILLSYIGIEIRKEDPQSLKEIISEVNKKYNLIKVENKQNVSKLKYIVEMIDDIKNNKYLKFNLSEKFNYFKTFVNLNKKNFQESNFDLSDNKIADKVDLTWNSLKNLDKNKIEDTIVEKNEDNIPEEDFGNQELEGVLVDSNKLDQKMKKFKMTTDLKKMIFSAIASATDCNDAFERLMRLNLKKDQAREIVKIIILLTTEEKSYNPFYKLLLSKLLSTDKNHKYTYHYTIWDNMKIMGSENYTIKKIHNLAKLTADLLVEEKISLPVFLNFQFEDADESIKTFLILCLEKYFEKAKSADKVKLLFAKLVKNDDHVEFAKRLFNFLINTFKKKVQIESKSPEFIECFTAASRVLKRIL